MIVFDIQGFEYGRNKEFAILNRVTDYFSHRFIKMPIEVLHYNVTIPSHMKYVTRNIHGLEYENNDNMKYEQISAFIISCIGFENTMFIKRSKKKSWLEKLLPNITIANLTEEECPSFEQLKMFLKSYHCNSHLCNNNSNCSLENVYF